MLAAIENETDIVAELVMAGANVDMQTKVCQFSNEIHVHVHVA